MCRLMAYSGSPILAADLLFRPSRSIVRQSFDAKERANGAQTREVYAYGQLNADGFGLAFYGNVDGGNGSNSPDSEDKVVMPCVFTECQPAWNSKNLRRLAEKIQARLFFAHVRAAGPGLGVCDCKTHPFTYGRFSFMHNGEIAGFATVRRKLLSGLKKDESFNLALAHGATDTAVAFALFVDQLSSPTESLSSFAIVHLLKNAIKAICDACEEAEVANACKLNFVVSDGQSIVATRYTFDLHNKTPGASLYYASGSSFAPTHNVEEATMMADPSLPVTKPVDFRIFHSERKSRMTIIASEPLTEVRSDWISVPDNHVVVVRSSGEVLCAPFFLRFEPCLRAKFAVSELTRVFSFLESQRISTTVPLVSPARRTLSRRESSFSSSTPAKSPRNHQGATDRTSSSLMLRCQSESVDRLPVHEMVTRTAYQASPMRPPAPLLKCRSSRMNSFELFEEGPGMEEPPTKKSTYGSGGAAEIVNGHQPQQTFLTNGLIEIRNPYHILAGSGQVHVSSMLRFKNHLFSADGGAAGGRVCVYDLTTFELVAWSSNWGILALCCDEAKGLLIGSRSDGLTVIWDISSSDQMKGELQSVAKIILPRIGHVLSMCTVQSSSLVVGSQDGYVRRIRLPADLSGIVRAIDCPAEIACDGADGEQGGVEYMKTCATTCVHCHEHEKLPICDMARSHCGFVTAVQLLEDQNVLFSAASCSLIKRWDLATNTCVETLGGHQGSVMDLCILQRGGVVGILFSASLDGTIRAWDVSAKSTSSHFLRSFQTQYDDPLSCLCMLPQQRRGYMDRICAGSTAGAVWIWEFTPAMLSSLGQQQPPSLSNGYPSMSPASSSPMLLPKIMLNVSSSPINSLACVREDGSSIAVGAGSGRISMWTLPQTERAENDDDYADEEQRSRKQQQQNVGAGGCIEEDDVVVYRTDDDALLACLAQFVPIRSISNDPSFREECLESANFILTLMEQLDCETRFCMARGRDGIPCILGRMRSSHLQGNARPYVFVYGHHDVVGANGEEWQTNPWQMQGVEGYLYGRGVSDNKGPILAMLFGAAELKRQGRLGVDVVFCVEGEEEASLTVDQRRLGAVLTDYADFIHPSSSSTEVDSTSKDSHPAPSCIVISNNTWINETRPCLTYGMRGVLDVELVVQSKTPNLHSGVHGGALFEPFNDLVNVLHTCSELKEELTKLAAPIDEVEMARLVLAATAMDEIETLHHQQPDLRHPSKKDRRGRRDSNNCDVSSLDEIIARWAQNSLSVSAIRTSNVDNSFRKVPSQVSAQVSVHFAPGLTVESCTRIVLDHFGRAFQKQQTANAFSTKIVNVSDPWLGDVTNPAFVAMSQAVEKVWGTSPLLVREGGSYSGITSLLERELRSQAVHLPMAQANDGAHLNDERIKVENLLKGKQVFQELLLSLGS